MTIEQAWIEIFGRGERSVLQANALYTSDAEIVDIGGRTVAMTRQHIHIKACHLSCVEPIISCNPMPELLIHLLHCPMIESAQGLVGDKAAHLQW